MPTYQTLNAADSLNGAGGIDTLNAELNTSVTPAQLTNIEVVNATATDAVTLGLANAGQVTNVNNINSFADLTVTGIAANAALGVQNVDSKNTTFTYANTTGTADSATLTAANVIGGASSNVSIAGVETVNIVSNGTTANNFKLTDAAATTVNVSGANALTLGLGASTAPTAINASNLTGNFTATMAGTGTLTGGSGNDSLTGADAVKATIIGGAGNDTITAGGGATHADNLSGGLGNDLIVNADLVANTATAANNDSIDGGLGFDTLSSTSSAFANIDNTATGAVQSISNIDALTVSDALANSLTLSKIQAGLSTVNLAAGETGARTITFDSAVANATVNLAATIDTAANFGVTAAGTATNDALTINNTATGAANVFNGGQIVATGYEALTLNGGTSVNGAQSLDSLTINTSNGNAATVALTGANAFTLNGVATNNTGVQTIDASGLTKTTGTVFTYADGSFATGSTQSIIGSAGNDLIEANNGNSATILGGAGIDTLTGGTAADSILGGTGNDAITGGGGNDVLKGEAGEDTITGNTGNDSIDGGADNDSLVGGGGNDTINGGDGVDTIVATVAGNVSIDAGAGNDRVEIGNTLNASDVLSGGTGTLDVLSTTTATIGDISTVTNFEVLELGSAITAQNMSKYTGNSGFTRVDALNTSGAAITAAGALLQEFRVAGGDNSFALATNTSADSLTVGAATDAATTVSGATANDMETVTVGAGAFTQVRNFAITGGNPTNGLTATKMTTLNIGAGVNANVLVVDQGDTTGAEVLTTVNATAATGTVKVDLSQFDVASVTMTGATATANTLIGGAGNDAITGGTAVDSLVGNAGNDTISGNGGDDYLSGGAGNDSLTGGTGNDSISGGDDNDTINSGSAGNDTIDGGNGANSVTTGSGNDSITTGSGADTITSGTGADTITSGSGNDVITSGAGANVITAGAGADAVTLTAGTDVDTVFQSASESIAATANGLSTTITVGDTLTFGNGVDNVQNFTAGTGGDVLAIGTVLKTALLGTAKTGTDIGYLSGNYNAVTGIFTVTDNGSGADTLALVAGTVATSASRAVILQGVNSASLVAANFGWNYTDLTSTYASTTWTVAGHAITGPLAINATSSNMATNISGGGTGQTITASGTYSVTGVTIIDLSGITGGFGTNVTLNGASGVNEALTSVVGTSGNDNFIFVDGADYGTGVVTINGGSAGTDTLTITNMEGSAKIDDTSAATAKNWLVGIENISLTNGTMNAANNSEKTLTIGTHNSASQAFAITNASETAAATVVLNANGATTYTSAGTGIDTVTLNALAQTISSGAGNDVITLGVTGSYSGNINLGTGDADVLALGSSTGTYNLVGANLTNVVTLHADATGGYGLQLGTGNVAAITTIDFNGGGTADTLALNDGTYNFSSKSIQFEALLSNVFDLKTLGSGSKTVTMDAADIANVTIIYGETTTGVVTTLNFNDTTDLNDRTVSDIDVVTIAGDDQTLSLDGAQASAGANFASTIGSGNSNLVYGLVTSGTAASVDLTATTITGFDTIDVTAAVTSNTLSLDNASIIGNVTLVGDTTTKIALTQSGDYRNLTLNASDFTDLIVTDGTSVTVDEGMFAGAIDLVQGSSTGADPSFSIAMGSATLDLSTVIFGTTNGIDTTVTGTAGNDTISLNKSHAAGSTMTYVGNNGNDVFKGLLASGNATGSDKTVIADAVRITDFSAAGDQFVMKGSELLGVSLTAGTVATGALNWSTGSKGFALITGAAVSDFSDVTAFAAAVGAVTTDNSDSGLIAVQNAAGTQIGVYGVVTATGLSAAAITTTNADVTLIGVIDVTSGSFGATNIGLY